MQTVSDQEMLRICTLGKTSSIEDFELSKTQSITSPTSVFPHLQYKMTDATPDKSILPIEKTLQIKNYNSHLSQLKYSIKSESE